MLHSFDDDSGDCTAFAELLSRRYVGDSYHLGARCANLEHRPHRYFLQHDCRSQAVARVVAIISDRDWLGQPVGMLGLYEAIEGTNQDLITQMIDAACEFLSEAGCRVAIGPMNGSTWFDYRFSVPGGGRPFFLDAYNPDGYLGHWLHVGFAPMEHYQTYAIERDRFGFSRVEKFSRRMSDRGVTLGPVDSENLTDVLPDIHELCLKAFTDNPLFTPIDFDEFQELYRPVGNLVDPRWALIARDGNERLLAFAFAFPDLFDTRRRSLVIKTVAVRRGGSATGLGAWMTELLHQRAHEQGMDRIYHALMHEHNASTKIHSKSSRVYKQYVLLGRSL